MRVVLACLFAAGTATFALATASAGPPPPTLVLFTVPSSAHQPVAGQAFAGLAIVSTEYTLKDVHCDGQIGFKRLVARKKFFYGNGRRVAVVCSWRIPATAGGKELRLWSYRNHRAVVTVGSIGEAESAELSWIVKNP